MDSAVFEQRLDELTRFSCHILFWFRGLGSLGGLICEGFWSQFELMWFELMLLSSEVGLLGSGSELQPACSAASGKFRNFPLVYD